VSRNGAALFALGQSFVAQAPKFLSYILIILPLNCAKVSTKSLAVSLITSQIDAQNIAKNPEQGVHVF
jgi:hypothetical protein